MLEVTFDGGETWQEALTTNVPGAALRQIDASDGGLIRTTFADENCQPQQARSFTGGLNWEPDLTGQSVWMLGEAPSTTAWAPVGQTTLPCAAVSLVGEGARAVALCEDTGITTTEDGGANWSSPAPIPGASAVGVLPAAFVIASFGEPDCNGIRTRVLNGAEVSDPGQCVTAEIDPTTIAVAGSSSGTYLWWQDGFTASADQGGSWS